MKSVLLLGSGLSAHVYNELDLDFDLVVAVNHGWMVTDDWKIWFHSRDFKGTAPQLKPGQTEVKQYDKQLDKYGGHLACGFSIMLCASYYVLAEYKPQTIFYLGADMVYQPDSKGHTHVYGVGLDVAKGKPDPDKMAERYGADDPDKYLRQIYLRFHRIAGENGCNLYNLSGWSNTRLPYPQWER